jgi:hypothetical protein
MNDNILKRGCQDGKGIGDWSFGRLVNSPHYRIIHHRLDLAARHAAHIGQHLIQLLPVQHFPGLDHRRNLARVRRWR